MSLSKPLLQSALQKAAIDIDVEQVDKLDAYLQLIGKWNRAYNLTAVREIDQMVPRHIIDSFTLLPYLRIGAASGTEAINGGVRDADELVDVIDIGSGAGLPVIPLAIMYPQLTFLSIESKGKKTRFQQQAKVELGLQNMTVLQERVENVQAQASCVVSRAFTAPAQFLAIAGKLCKPGGQVLIMLGKADKLPEQLPEPFALESFKQVHIAGVESERHIALVRFGTPHSI